MALVPGEDDPKAKQQGLKDKEYNKHHRTPSQM